MTHVNENSTAEYNGDDVRRDYQSKTVLITKQSR